MEDQIRNRIKELVAQWDQILGQINQNTTQRQQLQAAYQQTAGAIAGLYEFAPDAEVEAELEAPAENGQLEIGLVEA
jgi:Tfp pilus assembly protein FimV